MDHAFVPVIARTFRLLLVAGLVAGAMLATGPKYEAAATASLSAQVQDTAAETAEPSRLCTSRASTIRSEPARSTCSRTAATRPTGSMAPTSRGSIGTAASSGCIRLFNQDAIDLHRRIAVGSKVVVLTHG